MPLGAMLAGKVSPQAVDRIILAIMALLSGKLLLQALF